MGSPAVRLLFALAGLVLLVDGLAGIGAGVLGRADEPALAPFAPLLGPLHLPVAFVLLLSAYHPPGTPGTRPPDGEEEDRPFSRGLSVVFLIGAIWCGAMALHLVAGVVATARGLPQGPALTLRGPPTRSPSSPSCCARARRWRRRATPSRVLPNPAGALER